MLEDEHETTKKIPTPDILEVAKALASELRLRILETLSERPMSVTELTQLLGVAQPTISINIQILESAGLIHTAQRFGRGKICIRSCDTLLFDLPKVPNELSHFHTIQMPVGLYTDFQVNSPCGLVGREGLIGNVDDIQAFYMPERSDAFLVWFSEAGYLEYKFPNPLTSTETLRSLSLSAELCSEALGFKEDWPSDITLSINGWEIGTWTSPGDFGEKKGQLTPIWWVGGTQYGLLTEWNIHESGSSLNGMPSSSVTLEHLNLGASQPITVRFTVKKDAAHRGGLNILGNHFGNIPQDIKLVLSR
ncbi:MAG: ArsR family transcriptional regulator [Paenibacillus sp.]|nr:ArsR family transcriptional regulator [Paenibacillus sp.]